MKHASFSESTGTPFDGIAGSYDRSFEESAITHALRDVVHTTLLKYFRSGDHVLELNCGTGTDALFLASKGIRVTATDASVRMIEHARLKLSAEISAKRVHVEMAGFDDLHTFPPATYDGVFSNFGGLNCAGNFSRVAREIALRLKPDGFFVACLMNRYCLWESLSFLLRGKFREAMRRFPSIPTDVRVGDTTVAVTYYTPYSIARELRENFLIGEWYGLSIVSPSANSKRMSGRFPGVTKRLTQIDDAIRHVPPFRGLGDHFVIVARKKGV